MSLYLPYFKDVVEYADPAIVMMRPGVLQNYIPSDFLDGWINFVAIQSVFVEPRYTSVAEVTLAVEKYRSLVRDNPYPAFHTNFSVFGDEVLILAKQYEVHDYDPDEDKQDSDEQDSSTVWWLFDYDPDVSDCSIGRFKTDHSEQTVHDWFKQYAPNGVPVPVSEVKGWKGWK